MGNQERQIKEELRALLARELGEDDAETWALLCDDHYPDQYVQDLQSGEQPNFREILARAKRLRAYRDGRSDRSSKGAEADQREAAASAVLDVSELDRERAAAVSEFLARSASLRPDVREWRQTWQGGHLAGVGSEFGLTLWEAAERGRLPPEQVAALRQIVAALIASYPWSETEAADFLVSGTPPRVRPIRGHLTMHQGSDYRGARLLLEFDIRMSAKEIARLVRSAQRLWLKKENFNQTAQGLRVYRFAAAHWRDDPRLSPSDLWRRWRAAHPGEEPNSQPHFIRALRRAEEHLAGLAAPQLGPDHPGSRAELTLQDEPTTRRTGWWNS